MSNILVCKNYTIKDHTKWYDDRTKEQSLVDNYKEMESVCINSAKKYIKDLDEVKVFRGEADNIRDVFKHNFYEIYELWKEGHNILYCDLDVVFTQPVKYFEQFEHFSMFNFTDPTSTVDDHFDIELDYYFNCGIRYYPQNMSQDVWDVGLEMMEDWNPDRWDTEQIIYNAMMWEQDISLEEMYKPDLAFQALMEPASHDVNIQFNNGLKIEDAKAVHVHGSRGSSSRLRTMSDLTNL